MAPRRCARFCPRLHRITPCIGRILVASRRLNKRTAMVTDQPSSSSWLLTEAQLIRLLARRTTHAGLSATLEELAAEFDQVAWAAVPNEEARWQLIC